MTLLQIIQRVRQHTRDLSNSIFRERDIIDFVNEGLERMQQVIPAFETMEELQELDDTPSLVPKRYHHLLSTYATSRCFGQDERHYQSTVFSNEFETKLDELKVLIEIGDVIIVDEDGNPIDAGREHANEYVKNEYYY